MASSITVLAQDGANTGYTPYSIYGIGDLSQPGTAYNRSMGGVGVATRNRKFINYLNPAAVTARDSLSVLADLSISQTNTIFQQPGKTNVNHNVNLTGFAVSSPIYKSSAMMLGLTPFSSTAYEIMTLVDEKDIISKTGNIADVWEGTGGLNKFFFAAGVTFWKKLSLGAEYDLFFGKIEKEYSRTLSNSTYSGFDGGNNMSLRANAIKGGLQFEQRIGKCTLGFGATYRTKADLKGYIETYADTLSTTDTLHMRGAKLGSELSLGLSLRSGERWRAEVNYILSDWSDCGYDNIKGLSCKSLTGSNFSSTKTKSVRAGIEYTPNENDIRYYLKHCTYRAGVYYNEEYYKLDGNIINSIGVTLGATFPVFRLSNGLTVGVDFGQRGSMVGNMVRERFINFSIGFNAYDIWFHKIAFQ